MGAVTISRVEKEGVTHRGYGALMTFVRHGTLHHARTIPAINSMFVVCAGGLIERKEGAAILRRGSISRGLARVNRTLTNHSISSSSSTVKVAHSSRGGGTSVRHSRQSDTEL